MSRCVPRSACCERPGGAAGMSAITVYGVAAVGFMMIMYALEHRGPAFVLAFALGCALSSGYGFLAGVWPFGVVELVWSGGALRRYGDRRRRPAGTPGDGGPDWMP